MNEKFLVAAGFSPISVRGDSSIKKAPSVSMNISLIKPKDHPTPQVVLKVNRSILEQLNLEITDRVKVLVSGDGKTLVVSKGSYNDKNTFAVSCQGAKTDEAIQSKRGGVVKIGWREEFGDFPIFYGTYPREAYVLENSLVVQLP